MAPPNLVEDDFVATPIGSDRGSHVWSRRVIVSRSIARVDLRWKLNADFDAQAVPSGATAGDVACGHGCLGLTTANYGRDQAAYKHVATIKGTNARWGECLNRSGNLFRIATILGGHDQTLLPAQFMRRGVFP